MASICLWFNGNSAQIFLCLSFVVIPLEILFIAVIRKQSKINMCDILLCYTAVCELLTVAPYVSNLQLRKILPSETFSRQVCNLIAMHWCVTFNSLSHFLVSLLAAYRIYTIRKQQIIRTTCKSIPKPVWFKHACVFTLITVLTCNIPLYANATIIQVKFVFMDFGSLDLESADLDSLDLESLDLGFKNKTRYMASFRSMPLERVNFYMFATLFKLLPCTLVISATVLILRQLYLAKKIRKRRIARLTSSQGTASVDNSRQTVLHKLKPAIDILSTPINLHVWSDTVPNDQILINIVSASSSTDSPHRPRAHTFPSKTFAGRQNGIRKKISWNNISETNNTEQLNRSCSINDRPLSKKVHHHRSVSIASTTSISSSATRHRRRLLLLLLVMTFYMITQVPIAVLMFSSTTSTQARRIYHQCGSILDAVTMLNGSLYLCVYCAMNSHFQNALLRLVRDVKSKLCGYILHGVLCNREQSDSRDSQCIPETYL